MFFFLSFNCSTKPAGNGAGDALGEEQKHTYTQTNVDKIDHERKKKQIRVYHPTASDEVASVSMMRGGREGEREVGGAGGERGGKGGGSSSGGDKGRFLARCSR